MDRGVTRILSWNILQGGGRRTEAILQHLTHWSPDIVTLQEFRSGASGQRIAGHLHQLGLQHQFTPETADHAENTILLAARRPFAAGEFMAERSGPCHILEADLAGITLLPVHFPQKAAQVPLFNALLQDSESLLGIASLIIGDLNCGIPFVDSSAKTFTNSRYFQALQEHGWVDLYRQAHGTEAREFTWISPRTQRGFRYDHALASPALARRIKRLSYDHQPREAGHSDHSALLVDF